MPKFVILVHANPDFEGGKEPPTQEFIDMGIFNDELRSAGVLISADGLTKSADGARVFFADQTEPQVQSGPFQLDNLVAGFWILNLETIEEAVAWAKKIPFKTGSVEIRKMAGPEDFSAEFNEELRAKKEELGQKLKGAGGAA